MSIGVRIGRGVSAKFSDSWRWNLIVTGLARQAVWGRLDDGSSAQTRMVELRPDKNSDGSDSAVQHLRQWCDGTDNHFHCLLVRVALLEWRQQY